MTFHNWKHSNPASGTVSPATDLKINTLQVGGGDTYLASYSSEGDIYSEAGRLYIGSGATLVAEQYGAGLLVRS